MHYDSVAGLLGCLRGDALVQVTLYQVVNFFGVVPQKRFRSEVADAELALVELQVRLWRLLRWRLFGTFFAAWAWERRQSILSGLLKHPRMSVFTERLKLFKITKE